MTSSDDANGLICEPQFGKSCFNTQNHSDESCKA